MAAEATRATLRLAPAAAGALDQGGRVLPPHCTPSSAPPDPRDVSVHLTTTIRLCGGIHVVKGFAGTCCEACWSLLWGTPPFWGGKLEGRFLSSAFGSAVCGHVHRSTPAIPCLKRCVGILNPEALYLCDLSGAEAMLGSQWLPCSDAPPALAFGTKDAFFSSLKAASLQLGQEYQAELLQNCVVMD